MARTAYDPNLDVCIQDLGTVEHNGATLHAGVFSYNGGEAKLRVTRYSVGERSGREYTDNLVKMPVEDAPVIVAWLARALAHMGAVTAAPLPQAPPAPAPPLAPFAAVPPRGAYAAPPMPRAPRIGTGQKADGTPWTAADIKAPMPRAPRPFKR